MTVRTVSDRRVTLRFYSPQSSSDHYVCADQPADAVQITSAYLTQYGISTIRPEIDWYGSLTIGIVADGLLVGVPLGVYTAGDPGSWEVCDATLVLYDAFTGALYRELTLEVDADQTTNPGLIALELPFDLTVPLERGRYSFDLLIEWPAAIDRTTIEARGVIEIGSEIVS